MKMKREGSERIRRAVEGMTQEERLAYRARRHARLIELQQAVRRGEVVSFWGGADVKSEDGQASDPERP